MKKTAFKILLVFLILTITASCISLCACSVNINLIDDPVSKLKADASSDKYRNYYEIFVGSFADSDGDGSGDLQGIIDKLDYLNDGDPNGGNDLGVDGIWLTPIMPSHSYHKYDVEDYFDIDEKFGTIKDFDKLVKECHKRGIKIIIDLVLNHSSSTHPMFESAVSEIEQDGKPGKNAQYYEIKKYKNDPGQGYTEIADGYYYESNFSVYMPEWNLSKECTRDYFKKIAEFWLKEHGVDGFRLDATRYYTNSHTNGAEFLKWFYNESKKIKPDVYMVGENWTSNSEICDMYESGIDSFFAFGYADSTGGFVNAVRTESAGNLVSSVKNYEKNAKSVNPNAINSYFLSNHDQKRSANFIRIAGEAGTKMAAAMYMLMPGNSFIYYGEEIGQTQEIEQNDDEYKREPMIWDIENLPDIVVNGKAMADAEHASYGGVEQQMDDENSILSFYKRIIKIKNQNPLIARGEISEYELDDPSLCSYVLSDKSDKNKIAVIHNLSKTETKTAQIKESGAKLRGYLVASNGTDEQGNVHNDSVKLSGDTLTLPPYSTAVILLVGESGND